MKKICVLGLGYIGLPTASMFAASNLDVIGVDINQKIVNTLNNGEIHIEEEGLKEIVSRVISAEKLIIKNSPEPADVFIIAVPTPILPDKCADLRAVASACESILPHLRVGNLVVLESTSPPGTTINLVKPILERSGLKAGQDFLLVYSPERVLPGQIMRELVENARVIGGINDASAQAGRDLYATFVKGEILLTDATTAEMVKLMENTYRDVNIALANEFSLLAESIGIKINIREAIAIANYHPRVKILQPGPGVGGHCIAVDPWFLVEAAPDKAHLIRQARLINDNMPENIVQIAASMVKGILEPKIACLGLTYKADVDDVRESPSIEMVERLINVGYRIVAYDPYVKEMPLLGDHLVLSLDLALKDADLLLILVDHTEFKSLHPRQATPMRSRLVLDTRYCINKNLWKQEGFFIKYPGVID